MTDGVRKLFEKAEIIPKLPPPYGSLFLYDYTRPIYPPARIRNFKLKEDYSRLLLQDEKEKLFRKDNIEKDALERGMLRADKTQMKTTDIEANDSEAESRVESFIEISKRLKEHLEDMGDAAKGTDYKTAMYLRKLNLLTKKGNNLLCK